MDAGTTGGSAADDAHIFVVHNRLELVNALGGNNATNGSNATPKIVFVADGIEGDVDDSNNPLTCADYTDPAAVAIPTMRKVNSLKVGASSTATL